MKALFLLSAALFCIGTAQETYQLVWSDEFNGNTLDQTKWQYEVNCDGGGNNELQCYTRNAQNLKVADGFLTVTATPQNLNGKQYTSARINTRHSAAWKYGRFEARAKMPNGAYLWPALWMMPRDSVYGGWAASGEIDIYEGRGQQPNQYQSTLHYGGSWPNNVYRGSGERNHKDDLTAGFHIYSCTWTPQQISFAVDGVTFYTRALTDNFYSGRGANPYTKNGQPFDQPFYYIINLAIGGGFFGGNANSLTLDMARKWSNPNLVVDYVRVYQLGNNPAPNPNPVPVPTSVKTSATSNAAPKTSTSNAATPKPSQSIGISTAKSSAASSAISTAATSGETSKESSAGTTFYYSAPQGTSANPTSNQIPATSASNDSGACPNGCGGGNCCDDERMGGVCYNPNTHDCVSDESGKHLCGKGAGYCKSSGCYDAKNYKCVNGALAPL